MMDSKRRSSTNCNGKVNSGIVDLPNEVLSEILSRLPTESILICRVVCKTWCAVTRDPFFTNGLSNSRYQPTRLLVDPTSRADGSDHTLSDLLLVDIEKRKTRQIPIDNRFMDLQIMCCCDGFLCMASTTKLNPVVIYNPITRDQLILPPSNLNSPIICNKVGFGLDPSTDKYKVVRANTGVSARRKVRKFEIISLGESSWRELSAPDNILNQDVSTVVFWNGALYWTMTEGVSTVIVQFNLSDETFRVISFPRSFSTRHLCVGLIDVGGHLTLLQNDSSIIKFWRVRENKGGRDLSFSLKVAHDTHVKWGGSFRCSALCRMTDKSYLLHVGFFDSQKQQRRENLTQYFRGKVYSPFEFPGIPDTFRAVCFKPSLAPLPR